jgi:Tol biopolymer transport system component
MEILHHIKPKKKKKRKGGRKRARDIRLLTDAGLVLGAVVLLALLFAERDTSSEAVVKIEPVPHPPQLLFVANRDMVGETHEERYDTGDDDIFLLDIETGEINNLTNNDYTDAMPHWSPDGTQIVFSSAQDESGHYHLYLMQADGSDVRHLVPPGEGAYGGRWSPDGTKIAFFSSRELGSERWEFETTLYVMRVSDGESYPLMTIEWETLRDIRWSPDGNKIVFWSRPADAVSGHAPTFLRIISVVDSELLFAGSGHVSYSWSPDSTQLVYFGWPYDLYIVDVTTGIERRLTDHLGEYWLNLYPKWMPDGEWIVFFDGYAHKTHRIRPDGTNLETLADTVGDDYVTVSWSPDGTKIATTIFKAITPFELSFVIGIYIASSSDFADMQIVEFDVFYEWELSAELEWRP